MSVHPRTHTQAGSRGIKSHCVRSQSTERRIKDLRDVIWLIWGVLQAFGGTGVTARGDWHCWSVSHITADHSRGEQTNHTHEVWTHKLRNPISKSTQTRMLWHEKREYLNCYKSKCFIRTLTYLLHNVYILACLWSPAQGRHLFYENIPLQP